MVRVDLKEENGSKFIQIASYFPQYATINNDGLRKLEGGGGGGGLARPARFTFA